jgi:hypothetical protein
MAKRRGATSAPAPAAAAALSLSLSGGILYAGDRPLLEDVSDEIVCVEHLALAAPITPNDGRERG